jgi:hypothetical protein
MVYKFVEGSRLSGDAQAVGEALATLKAKRGALSPELVVTAAKKQASPLHGYFDCDDASAAHSYRKTQASHLIRSVAVKVDVGETPQFIRAYAAVNDSEAKYVDMQTALSQDVLRGRLLEQAMRELAALQSRYSMLIEFCAQIDRVRQQMTAESRIAA